MIDELRSLVDEGADIDKRAAALQQKFEDKDGDELLLDTMIAFVHQKAADIKRNYDLQSAALDARHAKLSAAAASAADGPSTATPKSKYDESDLEKGESWVADEQLKVLINSTFVDFYYDGIQESEREYQLRLTYWAILLESVKHLNYHKNLFNGQIRELWAYISSQHTPYIRETESEINMRLRQLKKTTAMGYIDWQNAIDACYTELLAIKREPDARSKISDILINLVDDPRYKDALKDIKKGSREDSFDYKDCQKILFAHARDINDLASKAQDPKSRQRVSGYAAEVPAGTVTASSNVYCLNQIRGRCTSSKSCKHEHLPQDIITAVNKALSNTQYCKQFLRGKCEFEKCRYVHLPDYVMQILRDPDGKPPPHPEAHAAVVKADAKASADALIPCGQMQHYGQCQFAEDCRYAHVAEISTTDLLELLQVATPSGPARLDTSASSLPRLADVGGGDRAQPEATEIPEILPINGHMNLDTAGAFHRMPMQAPTSTHTIALNCKVHR